MQTVDERRIAPWLDFAGKAIHEGDILRHPNGEVGIVTFTQECDGPSEQWRVKYRDGMLPRLILQIGDRGRAAVISSQPYATYDKETIDGMKKLIALPVTLEPPMKTTMQQVQDNFAAHYRRPAVRMIARGLNVALVAVGIYCLATHTAHAETPICEALARSVADSMKDLSYRKLRQNADGTERLMQMQAINANLTLMGQHKCTPVDFVIYDGAYVPNAQACEKDVASCPMDKWENTNKLGVRFSKGAK